MARIGLLRQPLRFVAGAAGVVFAGTSLQRRCSGAEEPRERRTRFNELPPDVHKFEPACPYPGWDLNWDCCELSEAEIAKRLKDEYPIQDYAEAIRKLYAAHTGRTSEQVDATIKMNRDDLPGLYRQAFTRHAWGGAATRHIILVRHGQYEECRKLGKKLIAENQHEWGFPPDTKSIELDEARKLTPLGRLQAEKTGDRLAAMLGPVLETVGREDQVRLRVSTLTRAKETAEIIATRLPSHVRQLSPDPMLAEGWPNAHTVPYASRGGERYLEKMSRDVHVDGSRIEAAFRHLFYRDCPWKRPTATEQHAAQPGGGGARHEYDIVVCHMNVIRFFVLRALQLPPEAWCRMGGFNGSITHLTIHPSGSVSLRSFGDAGHLSADQVTFGMHQGLE